MISDIHHPHPFFVGHEIAHVARMHFSDAVFHHLAMLMSVGVEMAAGRFAFFAAIAEFVNMKSVFAGRNVFDRAGDSQSFGGVFKF